MTRAVAFAALAVTLLGCEGGAFLGEETPTPGEGVAPPPEEVEIVASDGLVLSGTWRQTAGASRNPGVLLLHQFGPKDDPGCSSGRHDRSDFDGVVQDYVDAGVSVLAIDYRDHGLSEFSTLTSTCNLLSDRDNLPLDVRAGIAWLRERPLLVGRDKIGVVGISVGANLALTTANRSRDELGDDWGARGFVAISARKDRAADFDPQGDESLRIDNALLVVAEDEEPQATQNQEMFDENVFFGANNELLVRPGSAHGVDLLADDVVRERMVSWITELWDD